MFREHAEESARGPSFALPHLHNKPFMGQQAVGEDGLCFLQKAVLLVVPCTEMAKTSFPTAASRATFAACAAVE